MRERDPDVVTASEIASWAWCPEAWRLGDGLRLGSSNEAGLGRGEATHVKTAWVELLSRCASRAGWILLAFGGLFPLAIALFYGASR